jgi:hypothetical protein
MAEAAEATDNSPVLVQPTVTVARAQAFVPFSIEIQEDWGALESEMARLFQDSKDDLEGAQFVTGVGTTVFPQGFVTGTTATSAAATGLTVTAANLYALEAGAPPRFHNEPSVANRGIYNVVSGHRRTQRSGCTYAGPVTSPTLGNTGATLLGAERSERRSTLPERTKIDRRRSTTVSSTDRLNTELILFLLGGAGNPHWPCGLRLLAEHWAPSVAACLR